MSRQGDERNFINLFKFSGGGEVNISNCSFDIRHRGYIGSILWLQSGISGGYTARISNTSFYSTCSDEIISAFCSEANDVVFTDCTIEKDFYDSYYHESQTLQSGCGPFINSVYQARNKTSTDEVTHYVTYKNCSLICRPIDEDSSTYTTFLGLNSYYGDTSITAFDRCMVYAENIGTLVGGEQAYNGQYVTDIEDSSDFHERIRAVFTDCDMELETDTGGILDANSSNLDIIGCSLTTNVLINNRNTNETTVTGYRLRLADSDVYVTDADGAVFTVNKQEKAVYEVSGNTFHVSVPLLAEYDKECNWGALLLYAWAGS